MATINLTLAIDKAQYKIDVDKMDNTAPTLDFVLTKDSTLDKPLYIDFNENRINDLDKVNVLLLKSQNDKYDANIWYRIHQKETLKEEVKWEEKKLDGPKLLWLNINKPKANPNDPSLMNPAKIWYIEVYLKKRPPEDSKPTTPTPSTCVDDVNLQLIVVRSIDTTTKPVDPTKSTPDQTKPRNDAY